MMIDDNLILTVSDYSYDIHTKLISITKQIAGKYKLIKHNHHIEKTKNKGFKKYFVAYNNKIDSICGVAKGIDINKISYNNIMFTLKGNGILIHNI